MTEKRLTTDQIIPPQVQCLLLNAVTPKFSSLLVEGKKQDWKRCYKRAINTLQLHGTQKNTVSCDALQNQTQGRSL